MRRLPVIIFAFVMAAGKVCAESFDVPPAVHREIEKMREEIVDSAPKDKKPLPTAPPKSQPSQKVTKYDQERNGYDGTLNDAAIHAEISIYGRVDGEFTFLRYPDRIYTISGENVREGVLDLKLLRDDAVIGKASLHRDAKSKSSIRWEGEMKDLEGKAYRFILSRSAKSDSPIPTPANVEALEALKLEGMNRYEGTVTNSRGSIAQSVFKLRITGVDCQGFYYQKYSNGTTSKILRLHGDATPGELFLRESDNDGISAEFHLKKRLTDDQITWEGTLLNVRDNKDTKAVVFSRSR